MNEEKAKELLQSYNEFCDKYEDCTRCPNGKNPGACRIVFGYNAAIEAKRT